MKIGVAGSMQFTEQMMAACVELEKLGHTVFMSKFKDSYIGKTDEEKEVQKLQDKYKNDAIREFWQPMQDADALVVINLDKNGIKNYIGGNAFLEMGFAHVLNQKIYLLNSIPDMPFYGTEIIAMKPVVINNDFSKVK
jgi:predicted RNA-binding protein with PUA domain